ncbi:PLP-dependent aminotransferase family protein [Kiloniella majae]|uniref:aminotransferase-like domain-containing protein n=1 Tax=Kiloniella majae TaxID=1938558 RepID=UPI000A27932B|nr:PLP-dependent aminotransferase family protein [Kiloniella majae]
MDKHPFLYEKVASYVALMIDDGTLKPGEKAPSLRSLMRSHHISLATATQAYDNLEDRGYIEPKPQSGFYVCQRHAPNLQEPEETTPPQTSQPIRISKPIIRLLNYASDPSLHPFGCAIPSTELLSARKLDLILSKMARQNGNQHNIYSTPQGDKNLRNEIAHKSTRLGLKIDADDIAITNGCTEALTLALKVVTKPGDTVAIESPTYFGILQVLETLGLKAFELPTSKQGVNLDALKKAITTERITACLFASSYNNPLGCTLSTDQKLSVIELLEQYNIPLIEDDIYGDIFFGKVRPKSFLSLAPDANIIYCSSFSKSLAPGYRVGWIISPRYIEKITETKFALSLCCPTLLQASLAAYLNSGSYDRHTQRITRALQINIEKTRFAISEYFPEHTKVSKPAGGFVLWLELDKKINSADLFEKAINQGICFAPGNLFTTTDHYDNCIRISCGHEWTPALEKAIGTLGDLARKN